MRWKPVGRPLGCAVALIVAVALGPLPTAQGRDTGQSPRIGIFSFANGPSTEAAFGGLREGFRLAGMEPVVFERTAEDENAARARLVGLTLEKVDVVFALGGRAAAAARDSIRDRTVVFTAVAEPEARGLPGRGNVCGTAGGVPADRLLDAFRRAVPGLARLAVLTPGNDPETAHALAALEKEGAAAGIAVTSIPAEADVAAALRASLRDGSEGGADAVWLPPAASKKAAETAARALEGRAVALLGSTRGHLDAGCAVVMRTDPARLGIRAVVLAKRVLDGEAPSRIGVERPARHVLEVNLTAARRLGLELPLTLLAGADHIAPGTGVRR